MQKLLERPGGGGLPDEAISPKTDDTGMQKVLEARALLARIDERKARDAAELERRKQTEYDAIRKALKGRPKGGYCGCL